MISPTVDLLLGLISFCIAGFNVANLTKEDVRLHDVVFAVIGLAVQIGIFIYLVIG